MEIYKGLEIIDLSLYIKKYDILVISDLQLGIEESLNNKGMLIPRLQFNLIKKKLDNIFSKVRPKIIIINGDLKHEFGSITRQEWKETLDIIDYLKQKVKKIILIKGNHDVILDPIAKKRNLDIVEEYLCGDILILHGHKISLNSYKHKILIIGHEHPAISLKEEAKEEKYKCFLVGRYNNNKLIVMPSFSSLNIGTDVLRGKFLSPYLKQKIDKFNVFIVEDKVYNFGKIKNIK